MSNKKTGSKNEPASGDLCGLMVGYFIRLVIVVTTRINTGLDFFDILEMISIVTSTAIYTKGNPISRTTSTCANSFIFCFSSGSFDYTYGGTNRFVTNNFYETEGKPKRFH
jgi:hypothetical protein